MKLLFENEITIHKITILKKELDILIKERDKNQKIFDEVCDNIDNYTGEFVDNASAKLSILLDRSDTIYRKLNKLNELFDELRSILMN